MSKTRSHVLLTLGVLFTIGGATRILPHAFAVAESTPAEDAHQGDATAATAPRAEPVAYSLDSDEDDEAGKICFSGETAAALAADQKLFDERSQALQQQQIALQARSRELDAQAEELLAMQQMLETRWQEMTSSANKDIQHLAQMYSAMKPEQAAGIFNQMDPGFAAGFLRLMPSDQAGLILAAMQNEKAYIVSVKLAGKNGDLREIADNQAAAQAQPQAE